MIGLMSIYTGNDAELARMVFKYLDFSNKGHLTLMDFTALIIYIPFLSTEADWQLEIAEEIKLSLSELFRKKQTLILADV